MRIRWYIVATLVGVLAAVVVWAYPDGPMWRSGVDAGQLQEFSADGEILITTLVPKLTAQGQPDPIVWRWNAETGELLSRVVFPCKDPKKYKAVSPSDDGRLVLVGEGESWPARADFAYGDWYLHDGLTGQRLFGPIAGVDTVGPRKAFSPDGRWFHGLINKQHSEQFGWISSGIYSTTTGERLIPLIDQDGMNWYPIFASDSSSVVLVASQAAANGAGPLPVRIMGLPSGGELRRFELPGLEGRERLQIRRWDGRYLWTVQVLKLNAQGRKEWQQVIFDTSANPVGEGTVDPMLRLNEDSTNDPTFWLEAPDRAGFGKIIRGGQKSRIDEIREWLTAKLGIDLAPQHQIRANVRIVDQATGATRYQLPRPLAITICLSPDGRRLAATHDHDAIEVWDVNPPSRWPRVLAAGDVVAAGILGIGRWRRRREMARTSVRWSSPPA